MRNDDAYLLDMLVAARKAATYAEGLTYERFAASDLHQTQFSRSWRSLARALRASATTPRPRTREFRGLTSLVSETGLCMSTSILTSTWSGKSSMKMSLR